MKFDHEIKVYGDKSYRGDCPLEAPEQAAFFSRIRSVYPQSFGKIAVHNRNEGRRTWKQIAKEKAEGLTTGAPDICIPGNPTFLCELKRRDHTKSTLSEKQERYLVIADKMGSFCCIALGVEAAWKAFEEWRKEQVKNIKS